jgi:hypothetical protein
LSNLRSVAYTEPDRLIQDFASRGLVLLSPESLDIPLDVHARVYEKELAAYKAKAPVTPSSVPDVLEVLNSPGLVGACNQLVGENWAIVPFTHNASFTSGPRDQHWHKDDNGPYNSRKQRHHQSVQLEMLYYPQDVREDMGPTATIPYSQYWTYNHEENHDNFAGADHLDFAYQLSGMEREPANGPDTKYETDDIVNARTPHDVRMREAVTNTGWPLVQQFEAAPLRAGSIVLYSHNTFHRGNHRRDDWRTWQDNPRFMWRFWLYRTTDPTPAPFIEVDWATPPEDPLTGIDLSDLSDDVTAVWRYHDHWIRTAQSPPAREASSRLSATEAQAEADRLYDQLHTKGDDTEAIRIGAAYKLASIGDTDLAVRLLAEALLTDRESVRRAATYGLIAVGSEATPALLEATRSPVKWIRKAGVYGLGDASPLTEDVLNTVVSLLQTDASVYVRSVAAGTLGCLGRRAVASGDGVSRVKDCVGALLESLSHEENRPAMDIAQGRSIKFVRPTDDCDVCEGGGIDFSHERFKRVRSAVRENALWSLVILCSHGTAVLGETFEAIVTAMRKIIREEENVICVGLALDVLNRLANLPGNESSPQLDDLRSNLMDILAEPPVRGWEALVRGGLSVEALSRFATS